MAEDWVADIRAAWKDWASKVIKENQMAYIEDEPPDSSRWHMLNGYPVWVSCEPKEPRPDLVITPATDQTVRVKFDKREHEIAWGTESEDAAELIIKPLVKE